MKRSNYCAFPRRFGSGTPRASRLTVCIVALAIAIGCLSSPGCQTSKPIRAPETFDDIYQSREIYRDSLITLKGYYMGWQGTKCVFPSYAAPQESRSDWIFMIGDSCMYVTGGEPPDVSPMEGTGVGSQIRLDARLRIKPDSRLLLEYVRSVPLSQ